MSHKGDALSTLYFVLIVPGLFFLSFFAAHVLREPADHTKIEELKEEKAALLVRARSVRREHEALKKELTELRKHKNSLIVKLFAKRARMATDKGNGQSKSSSEAKVANGKGKTWGYKCAVIDEGYVDKHSTLVHRYGYLIEELAHRYGTSEEDIADAGVTARNHLRNTYGKEVKVLELLEKAEDYPPGMVPDDPDNDKVTVLFALIILDQE